MCKRELKLSHFTPNMTISRKKAINFNFRAIMGISLSHVIETGVLLAARLPYIYQLFAIFHCFDVILNFPFGCSD